MGLRLLRERKKKTLILIHCVYLQLRKYIYTRLGVLTTIHVTYIKKERLYTINSLYSTEWNIIFTFVYVEYNEFIMYNLSFLNIGHIYGS